MRSLPTLGTLVLPVLIASCAWAAPRVVLDPSMRGNRALVFAAGEIASAAGISVVYDTGTESGDIVIGRMSKAMLAMITSARLKAPASLRAEGFAIRREGGVVAVIGADDRGDVYGALWLAECLRLDPRNINHPDCVREPALRYREFTDGHEYLRPPSRGYEGWLHECLKLGINTIQHAGASPEEARLAKAYGLWYMGGTAPFSNLPVDAIISRYGTEVSEFPGQLCPLKPCVWEEQRSNIRAMLKAYPEIDFVRASMGDLPEDFHVYDCHGPECAKIRKAEGLLRACQATADVVVGEFGKTFFISSWGNPPERYPLNLPEDYTYIMDRLPRDGIVSTVNNTQHDFYLNSPENPLIGLTDRPKDLYFEVTTEYAGAGFLPVYIGPQIRERLAHGLRTGHTVGVTGRLWEGVGLWTRDVLWTRANLYAIYRAAWEPTGNPREWARDWAALTFGQSASAEMADALMLSEELARRTFWVPGFSGEKGPAYAITRRNVITDGTHYIRWAKYPQLEAYRRCAMPGKYRAALKTTSGALQLRDLMLERWNAAKPNVRDAKLAAACDRDFQHFSAVVDVLIPYQRALLHWCHTKDAGVSRNERCRSARESVRFARATQLAWERYRERFDLYRDSGMTEMLGVYLRDCAAIATPAPDVAAEPGAMARAAVRVRNNAWPDGLNGLVRVSLPDDWPGERVYPVRVPFAEQCEVSLQVSPPAGSAEGDVQVPVRLEDRRGRTLETTSVRVKVLRLSGNVGSNETGSPRPVLTTAERVASAATALDKKPVTQGNDVPTASRPTTICPRITEPPVIDGVLEPGEWPTERKGWAPCPVRIDASSQGHPYTVAARWAWDDRCLYVAFEVADDDEIPLGIRDTIYRSDRVHLVLDLDGDRRDDYEIAFVRSPDAFLAWPITVDGVFTSTQVAYRAKVAESARGLVVAAGQLRSGTGRVIEAAIPWSWLGGYRPAVGRVAGVSVQGGDVDAGKGLRAAVQWPSRAQLPDGPYLTWGRVGKPTLFADVVFTP